ncbi:MAG: hypothetical protein FJ387_20825 [Verrucomicrobia bacterium]|nr:hypothetical protein [Verrucomicrobiota bacterium]
MKIAFKTGVDLFIALAGSLTNVERCTDDVASQILQGGESEAALASLVAANEEKSGAFGIL